MQQPAAAARERPQAPLSLFARLELAVARHARHEDEGDEDEVNSEVEGDDDIETPDLIGTFGVEEEAKETRMSTTSPAHPQDDERASTRTRTPANSVAALADQLQALLQPKPRDDPVGEERDDDAAAAAPHRLQNALAKIGADEKDELLAHLLRQAAASRAQLSEVAALGETIAAQLVRQQHELRGKHREQLESLRRELHDAVHAHPRVAALEDKVEALEEQLRAKDQQLRFAVQKLQRSRQRERELKTLHDPLWVI